MKQKILFLSMMFFGLAASAQTVLLSVNPEEQKKVERGPNLKKHVQGYLRLGFVSGESNPGAEIVYGNSIDLAFGIRKRYKISSVYSLGFDAELQFLSYRLDQTEGKIFPDTIINKLQSFDCGTLGFGFFNRINFDPRRGNFLGTFLDLGVMGRWHISTNERTENKLSNGTTENKSISDLPYTNSLSANAYIRLGFSHGSVYGSYRITDLFKPSYHYPELPRFILGIELSVF